jgi:hypothetical protein
MGVAAMHHVSPPWMPRILLFATRPDLLPVLYGAPMMASAFPPTPPPRSPRPLLASSSSRSAPESALRHGRQDNLAATGELAVPRLLTLHDHLKRP